MDVVTTKTLAICWNWMQEWHCVVDNQTQKWRKTKKMYFLGFFWKMRLDWCWGGLGCKEVDLHNLHKTFDDFRWKLRRDKKTLSLCHSPPSDHLSSMWSCFHMGTKESLLESKTCLQAKTLTDGGRLTLMQFGAYLVRAGWMRRKQLVYNERLER